MKPFDLILFKGSALSSEIIKIGEYISTKRNDFTHVAILVNNIVLPIHQLLPNTWYILESTVNFSGPLNVLTNKHKFGVQIRNLNQVIDKYNGEVYHASINKEPVNPEQLLNIFNENKDKIYELNCLELCASAFKCCRKIRDNVEKFDLESIVFKNYKDDDNMLYCSELVAIVLKQIGILPDWINSKNYIPVDVLGIRDNYPNIVNTLIKIK